ncbi:MAG: phosphoserine phosphatase SerB [Pseudomonadota bacterium]
MIQDAASNTQHTVIAVATTINPAIHTQLEQLVRAALLDAAGRELNMRDLCPSREDFALCADLPLSGQAASDLRATLSNALQGQVDVAVVPTAATRKRLLICDMDSTVIGQECLDELADFAGRKSEVSAITERAMAGELEFDGALTERVAMLAGLELSALQACFEERISLNAGARTLVATMKAHGARAVLVSGGFTFFTGRVAEAAGFEAHRGNTLIDDGAALTGKVGQPILGREAKLTALEDEITALKLAASDVLAMGDGANDLAMIEAAGLGVAYRAKPVVAAASDAAIDISDLTAALYFQGYERREFEMRF